MRPLRTRLWPLSIGLLLAFLLAACSPRSEPPSPPKESPAAQSARSFVGRTWQVISSTAVVTGTRYTFEPDGRLLITSPGSLAAEGRWNLEGDKFTWVEESQTYRVEILKQTDTAFQVRVHSPGEPLDISMIPADAAP